MSTGEEVAILFVAGTRGTQVHVFPEVTSPDALTSAFNGVLRKLRLDLNTEEIRLMDADGVEMTVENIAVNRVTPVFVLSAENQEEERRRDGIRLTNIEDLYVNERGKVLLQRPEKRETQTVTRSFDSYKPRSQVEFVQMMNANRDPLNRGTAPLLNLTLADIAGHNTPDDAWIALNGKVYDMSKYVACHPGGRVIMQAAGKDGTALYRKFHPWVNADALIGKLQIGILQSDSSSYLRP